MGRVRWLVGILCVVIAGAAQGEDLRAAVKAGDAKRAAALLKAGADPNACDDQGRTALHDAAASGDAELIELLLAGGASLDAREDVIEATPLALAVIANRHRAVAALLKHRPDLAHGASNGSILFLAAEHGDAAMLRMLLDSGVDVRQRARHATAENANALMAAAGAGNVEVVRVLLEVLDPNERDGYGDHSLNWAAHAGRFEIVSLLLDSKRKVDLNVVGYGKQTALDMALAGRHDRMADLLRSRGAKRASEL